VMPTSLIYNWLNEAKKFTPELKILVYSGADREKDVSLFAEYDVVLTSYGLARIDEMLFQQFYFNYIILDESQSIKNPFSNTSKAIKTFKSRHRLLLSGTPIENSITDLWSQMNFANPGLLGSFNYFKEQYVLPIEKEKDEVKKNKLYALIKPFILRRTKSQVADDLPEKVEQVFYCDMTEAQRDIYEEVKSTFRNELFKTLDQDGLPKAKFSLLAGLVKLRQIANHPAMTNPEYEGESGKFNEVILMIENALAEGHKMLIFSQFVKQLSIYRNYFEEKDIPYSYLDGSVKKRQPIIDDFQNNDQKKIFLISLKVGGVGLNLTAADYVFILDPWWNPAVEQQAIDRTHRIGQKNTVFTYKFISKDTVEEKILKLQQRKSQLANNLITTEDSFIKSLSEDDIKAIFD
jgi:SNF2 family DNA or RNA helicase